ncbi:MAG TPA: amidohydrolase family protein [Steroidobacteraceae bacterium]|nr:amidohydrolase family protein [Steroidobacteraceae bacterium]
MKYVWFAALAASIAVTAGAAETTRYVALVNGGKDKAGHQWVTRDGNKVKVDFIFKDNGRGPEQKEEFTLDENGVFTRYHVTGTTTFGSKIDETFTRTGNTARWKSTSDRGEQQVDGAPLYQPLNGTPESFTVALAALAKRPDGKLPMIPSGTLTARKLLEHVAVKGGEKQTVQLLALTGVGFTPITVWATTGASPKLFAFIYPGSFHLMLEGWEANAAALEAEQIVAEKEMLVDLNKRVSHPLTASTLIRNARVFDSEKAQLGGPSDVFIEDGRIISVVPTGTETRKPSRTVDAGGRVLLPGMFDMHTHLGFWDGGMHLAVGVTSVRDMGNDNETLLKLMDQEKAGTLLMPRVTPAGFIEGESTNASRSGFVIKNLDEAKHAIDWYHEHGWPQIKIYNSFPKDILPATTEYAHARGMRVSGHIPAFLRAQDAVLAGYDEIQHINQVLLNFLVDEKTDTRTLQRFYLPAEKVADLDFDSKPVQDFIALLVQRKTVIDPTLATFNFIRQKDGVLSQEFAAVADHVPPDVRRGFYSGQINIPDDKTWQRYEKSYAKMIEFTGRMVRAGIPIVAGTDDLPGFTYQRELELYVEAGLTPSQALQVATWNGARYARVLDDRGAITPGRRADLILVDGEPTTNISDIRKVALVIKGDVAYYPSEMFEALGVKAFTPALRVD